MSGLAGLWRFDSRPAEESRLRSMLAALTCQGDADGVWADGRAGLACRNLGVVPESYDEVQPLELHGVALVFDGRLDNRDELIAALPGERGLGASASDAALIATAYRAWGVASLKRLLGDFSLALVDRGAGRLLLARDAVGVRPLYYARFAGGLAFSSEIRALLALPGIPARPDREALAAYLLRGDVEPSRTFFEGVESLKPGHRLLVEAEIGRQERYWDFEPGPLLRLSGPEEYAEAFGERFRTAVRRRLRSRTAAAVSVSGGVDSSSILSAGLAFAEANDLPAPALFGHSHIIGPGTASDERRYLDELERRWDVRIERLPAGATGLEGGLRELVRLGETPLAAAFAPLAVPFYRSASERGVRTVLTGGWADQVCFSFGHLVDWARRGRWLRAWKELRGLGAWMTDVPAPALRRLLLSEWARSLAPRPLLEFLRRRRGDPAAESYAPWVREAAHDLQADVDGPRFPTLYASGLYAAVRSGHGLLCRETDLKIARAQGVELSYPFLDRELIGFMLSIPGEIQANESTPKWLLRRSMRGSLPDAIRLRRDKGDYTEAANAAARKDWDAGVSALRSGRAAASGFLSKRGLSRRLSGLRPGLERADSLAAGELWRLLGLEFWVETCLDSPRTETGVDARETCR